MSNKRVVITGMGALTPIGNNVDTYWDSLAKGVSGAAPITLFDASPCATQFACEVKNFNPEDHFDKRELRRMDRFSQYAVVACDEAIKDADLDLEKMDPRRVGVVMGSGIGGLLTFEEQVVSYVEGGKKPRFNPFFIPKMIVDMAAGNIAIKYGFRGPNYATVSACASSSNALIDAFHLLKLGHADIMITGGAECTVNASGVGGFNALRAMSVRNDDPKTASRPFDQDRDGFVMGEGAGVLVLETYEGAIARGATIYAEVIGVGMSADAYHITTPHPEGIGLRDVMNNALQDAAIDPKEVDYVNSHGTSTPVGDVGEAKAIAEVFGDHAYQLNISATKSMTGHLLGASGAVECIATVLAIKHQIVPPTINHFNLDKDIDPKLNFTFNKAESRTVNVALSNNFGFGGHNCSIIFKKI